MQFTHSDFRPEIFSSFCVKLGTEQNRPHLKKNTDYKLCSTQASVFFSNISIIIMNAAYNSLHFRSVSYKYKNKQKNSMQVANTEFTGTCFYPLCISGSSHRQKQMPVTEIEKKRNETKTKSNEIRKVRKRNITKRNDICKVRKRNPTD